MRGLKNGILSRSVPLVSGYNETNGKVPILSDVGFGQARALMPKHSFDIENAFAENANTGITNDNEYDRLLIKDAGTQNLRPEPSPLILYTKTNEKLPYIYVYVYIYIVYIYI